MTIRIQLVNEQNLIREGLICLLKMDQDVLILPPVQCGTKCVQECLHSKCDVLIVGTNTGASGALNCLRQIASRCADTRILLIINREHSSLVNEAIRLGAKGVVTMDVPSQILRQSVKLIAEGGKFIEPWLARAIAEKPHNYVDNPFDSLSPREQSVLHMMLSGHSGTSIATELHISEKTVANHHTHIMNKLDAKNLVELTRMAIRHNLIRA